MAETIEDGQALAYSLENLDGIFREKYPGYIPELDWGEKYGEWTETVLDTLRGALNGVNLQSEDFVLEHERMRALEILSNAAEGRKQALQAGNMIASATVKQLIKLRQLLMMQINSQNTFMASEVNKEAQMSAKVVEWLTSMETEIPRYNAADYRGSGPRDRWR